MTYIKMTALISGMMLLLTACGNEEPKSNAPEENVSETTQESSSKEETTPKEETTETDVKEETIEEVEELKPEYMLNEANWTLKPIADAPEKVVLFTIDDAPDKHALQMATTLKELQVPAIFFVNGHFIDSEEEKTIVKKIHDMGFSIGNHTQTHANLKQLSEDEQRTEILTVSDEVEAIIGERPQFFRAPFGSNTDFSKQLVREEGMLLMNWTYGYDWEKAYMTSDALADIMVNTPLLVDGANLLMHDREWTNAALPAIVQGFKEQGYGFVDPRTIQPVAE